jgi:hypothetical protein
VGRGLAAYPAGWKIPVLLANHGCNFGWRNVKLCHTDRIEDQPHGVVLSAKDDGVSDTGKTLDAIKNSKQGVVREINGIVPGIGRTQRNDRQHIRRHFFDSYTLANDFVRQLRFGETLPVLCLDLRDIHIGSDFKREPHRHVPIVCARGVVVKKVIDTGKLDFYRTCDCFRDNFCAGTGIVRFNLHHRWRDLRKLRNRQVL